MSMNAVFMPGWRHPIGIDIEGNHRTLLVTNDLDVIGAVIGIEKYVIARDRKVVFVVSRGAIPAPLRQKGATS